MAAASACLPTYMVAGSVPVSFGMAKKMPKVTSVTTSNITMTAKSRLTIYANTAVGPAGGRGAPARGSPDRRARPSPALRA
ncbi:hypothetical protein GCM10009544_39090 [Streptomyces stramineus]|uniref:Uncharacterized protein n=1 Tax=Streptomyces stramineus TaxID=173861 RepID=A0ABP3K768_9ACTN